MQRRVKLVTNRIAYPTGGAGSSGISVSHSGAGGIVIESHADSEQKAKAQLHKFVSDIISACSYERWLGEEAA